MSSPDTPGLTATVTGDGRHINLRGQLWSETFPASALPHKIAFYEALRDRRGGAYAKHYEPTVKALRRAQKIYQALTTRKEA